jgi:hypothetical protein
MKKFLLVFALMLVANTAFAQEEEASRWTINAQLRAGAFISEEYVQAGFGGWPRLFVGFDFNEHVEAYAQFRIPSVQGENVLNFIRNAWIQANVLGLLGVEGHVLNVRVGRTDNWNNDFGVQTNFNAGQYTNYNNGNWGITNGGSPFTVSLYFIMDPAVFPLFINWSSNLNMSAGVGVPDDDFRNAITHNTTATRAWVGALDIGFRNLDLGAVALSANLYGNMRADANINDLIYNTTRAGASVGVTVNNLPVNLRFGANFELTLENNIGDPGLAAGTGSWGPDPEDPQNTWQFNPSTVTALPRALAIGDSRMGFGVGAGVALGITDIFTSALNFAALISDDDWLATTAMHSDINFRPTPANARYAAGIRDGATMHMGLDFKLTALSWLQPYLSLGAVLATANDVERDWFNTDVGYHDRLSWMVGVHFPLQNIPVGRVDLYMGWHRGSGHDVGLTVPPATHQMATGLGGFALVVRASM